MRLGLILLLVSLGACGEDALHDRGNRPPLANCGSDRQAARGEQLLFDASRSTDPDGDELSYSWEFGDGATADGTNVLYTYAAAGVFTVMLTATDERGATGTASARVTVTANLAPVAEISAPTTASAGSPLLLDGSNSHDPDGTIVSYAWNYDVGGQGSGAIVEPVFSLVGPIVVTLTVTDDEGAQGVAQATVALSANYNGTWAWGLDNAADASDASCGTFYASTIVIAVSGSSITFTEHGTLGDVVYTGSISGTTFSATAPLSGLGGTQTIAGSFTTPTHFAGTYHVEYSALGCNRTRNVHGDKQ